MITITAVLWMSSTVASAAPPEQPPAPVDEAQQRIDRAQELFALGEASLELGQYDSTIALWQEAYDLLPATMEAERAELEISLADVHRRAHEQQPDPEHLRSAKKLYSDHLARLDADHPTRAELEAELAKVETELEAVEAAEAERARLAAEENRRKAEQAEAQLEAARAAEREMAERANAEALAQLRFRTRIGVGSSLAGIGVVSLGAMVAGLALGADVENRGKAADANPETPPEEFQKLHRNGTTYNQMAWATGVIGGAFLISGAVVVIVAMVERGRTRGNQRAQLRPWMHGLEVQF
jgi:hypothetical protein